VIGLVQVGAQALADRYTYLPLIGLFIIMAWGLGEMVSRRPVLTKPMVALTAGALAACIVCTWLQVSTWRNSRSLWEHAVQVADSYVARNNLAIAILDERGKIATRAKQAPPGANSAKQQSELRDMAAEAEMHLRAALRFKPDYPRGYANLGEALDYQDRTDEAIEWYSKALAEEDQALWHNNLGVALAKKDRLDVAIWHFQRALALAPDFTEAQQKLDRALAAKQKNP
jgi:tetratricopeptide (TPR) repeat protein